MERMENNIDFPKIVEDEYHKEHVLCKKLVRGLVVENHPLNIIYQFYLL